MNGIPDTLVGYYGALFILIDNEQIIYYGLSHTQFVDQMFIGYISFHLSGLISK